MLKGFWGFSEASEASPPSPNEEACCLQVPSGCFGIKGIDRRISSSISPKRSKCWLATNGSCWSSSIGKASAASSEATMINRLSWAKSRPQSCKQLWQTRWIQPFTANSRIFWGSEPGESAKWVFTCQWKPSPDSMLEASSATLGRAEISKKPAPW